MSTVNKIQAAMNALIEARSLLEAGQRSDVANLKPTTVLRVFHASDADDIADFIKNGIDARRPTRRKYPHWVNVGGKRVVVNRGLFVAPNLGNTWMFGGIAVSFKALGKNLFPPFPSPDAMRKEDGTWGSKFPQSFRPSTSAYLSGKAWGNEPQALFRGLVSPRAIERVYLHSKSYSNWGGKIQKAGIPFKEGTAGGILYFSIDPKDFESMTEVNPGKVTKVEWLAEPQERISFDEYVSRLMQEHDSPKKNIYSILKRTLGRESTYEAQLQALIGLGSYSHESFPYSVAKLVLREALKKLGVEAAPSGRQTEQYHGL